MFICITKDETPPGQCRRLRPHASQCHWVVTPIPPPPSKPSTHGSSLLVLCSQRHPHHPQHERQEVNSPRPAHAVHATGFSLARLIILLSSPSPPPLSSPSSSSSNHSPPPCGLSLIKERSPSPIYCRHFEDLRPHRRAPRQDDPVLGSSPRMRHVSRLVRDPPSRRLNVVVLGIVDQTSTIDDAQPLLVSSRIISHHRAPR